MSNLIFEFSGIKQYMPEDYEIDGVNFQIAETNNIVNRAFSELYNN